MTHHITLKWMSVEPWESWQRLTLMITEWLMHPGVWLKWKTTGCLHGHGASSRFGLGVFKPLSRWCLFLPFLLAGISFSSHMAHFQHVSILLFLVNRQLKRKERDRGFIPLLKSDECLVDVSWCVWLMGIYCKWYRNKKLGREQCLIQTVHTQDK